MSMRVAVENLLKRAVVTMTPAAETDQGTEFLSDGPGKEGAVFGDLTANPTVTIYLGLDISGANGAPPLSVSGDILATDSPSLAPIGLAVVPWTFVTNTADDGSYLGTFDSAAWGDDPADDHDGNDRALSIASSTNGATAKLLLTAKAGHTYRIKGWVTNNTGDNGSIRLRDTVRNLYLKTDGTFAAGPQDLVIDTTTDKVWLGIGAGAGVLFTLPAADEVGSEDFVLELQLTTDSPGFVLYDDLSIAEVFAADLMMIAGNHNFPLSAVLKWDTSDDGSSWTNRATFTVARNQFWKILQAPVTAAFHRLQMTGTPLVQHFIGDLVLALLKTFPRTAMEKLDVQYEEKGQARQQAPGGTEWVANRGPYPPRTLSMTHRLHVEAEEAAAREILIDDLRGGANECVVFPSTKHFPRLGIYGRLQQPITFTMATQGTPLPETEEAGSLEHYSDVSVTFVEGAGFDVDD